MNRYAITINNNQEQYQDASKAYTAVRNAMARHVEGEFKPCATIKIRFIGKAAYTWEIVAEVPFDYGENDKGYSRKTVAGGFKTEQLADIEMQCLAVANPEWKHIRLVRRIRN